MTEDEIRELFLEMRDEPVPADSLARVRHAVAKRTQARSWAGVPWKIGAMVVAAACVVIVVMLSRTTAPIRKPTPPVVARESAPALVDVVPTVARPAVRPARRVRHIERASSPILIRIETPDPEVVILLVGG